MRVVVRGTVAPCEAGAQAQRTRKRRGESERMRVIRRGLIAFLDPRPSADLVPGGEMRLARRGRASQRSHDAWTPAGLTNGPTPSGRRELEAIEIERDEGEECAGREARHADGVVVGIRDVEAVVRGAYAAGLVEQSGAAVLAVLEAGLAASQERLASAGL